MVARGSDEKDVKVGGGGGRILKSIGIFLGKKRERDLKKFFFKIVFSDYVERASEETHG